MGSVGVARSEASLRTYQSAPSVVIVRMRGPATNGSAGVPYRLGRHIVDEARDVVHLVVPVDVRHDFPLVCRGGHRKRSEPATVRGVGVTRLRTVAILHIFPLLIHVVIEKGYIN